MSNTRLNTEAEGDSPDSIASVEVAPAPARTAARDPGNDLMVSAANWNAQTAEAFMRRSGGPEALADKLYDIMQNATVTARDGSKTPDWKTQLTAVLNFLYFTVGRPIERQQVITAKVESESETELITRLAHSPAMREALREVLAEAEKSDKPTSV